MGMPESFGSRIIRAYKLGVQARRERERDAQQRVDNEERKSLRDLQVQALRFSLERSARDAAVGAALSRPAEVMRFPDLGSAPPVEPGRSPVPAQLDPRELPAEPVPIPGIRNPLNGGFVVEPAVETRTVADILRSRATERAMQNSVTVPAGVLPAQPAPVSVDRSIASTLIRSAGADRRAAQRAEGGAADRELAAQRLAASVRLGEKRVSQGSARLALQRRGVELREQEKATKAAGELPELVEYAQAAVSVENAQGQLRGARLRRNEGSIRLAEQTLAQAAQRLAAARVKVEELARRIGLPKAKR